MADLGTVNVQFWDLFDEIVTSGPAPSIDDVYTGVRIAPDQATPTLVNELVFGGPLFHRDQGLYPVGPSKPPQTPRLTTGTLTYLLRGYTQDDQTDPISRKVIAIDMETNEVVGETRSSVDGYFEMKVITTGRVRVLMPENPGDGKNTVILSDVTPIPTPATINIPNFEG